MRKQVDVRNLSVPGVLVSWNDMVAAAKLGLMVGMMVGFAVKHGQFGYLKTAYNFLKSGSLTKSLERK